jgi:hypothetical protein
VISDSRIEEPKPFQPQTLDAMLKTKTVWRTPPCPVTHPSRVAHTSTGEMLLKVPEPVDPLGNPTT